MTPAPLSEAFLSASRILQRIWCNGLTSVFPYLPLRGFCDVPPKTQKMVRVLNVAEKNDAAKNIAEILSRGHLTRREGFSKYNKIYEFDHNLNGNNVKMVMTSVSGHLLNYAFSGAYKKWEGCNPLDLFSAPVFKVCPEDSEPIKRTLEREARSASKLIIWTDCDREGENIGFEIIQVCQAVKPSLQVQRAKFSEITFRSIQRALETLTRPDENLNNAVNVRSELDLRIGAAFTRFQTLRLKKIFPETLADTILSYGSCQFPTLGFIIERFKAIENFIPEQFWKLKVTHNRDDIVTEFTWQRKRLFHKRACEALFDVCQENPEACITKVTTKPKSKWRPQPLDTVELEKLGSRKLRMNVKEVMKVAEKLYTNGFISYPRTETNIFPQELELAPLVEMQTADPNWGGFAAGVLERGPNPRQGKKTDQAHPPIHPTKYTSSLSGAEKAVYDLVVRHFLACLSDDARGMETVVDMVMAGEGFHANGLVILERNYLEVYPYENWSGKVIAHYEQGQTFQPTTLEMVSGETSAPPYLTEADLIALMEKHGIGTDATHAEHIEKIKQRNYAGLENNHFLPGKIGLGLVEGYDDMGFQMSKPNLRAELESDLKEICEGTKDPQDVLRQQIEQYRSIFEEAMPQALKIDAAMGKYLEEMPQALPQDVTIPDMPQFINVCKCPACGSDMVLRERQTGGFFISCQGFPHCRVAVWFPSDVKGVTVLQDTCTQCCGSPKKLEFKLRPNTYVWSLRNPCITCIGGCDEELYDLLQFKSLKNCLPPNTGGQVRSGAVGEPRLDNTRGRPVHSRGRSGHGTGEGRQWPDNGGGRPGPGSGGGRPGPGGGGGRPGPGSGGGRPGPSSGRGRPGPGRGRSRTSGCADINNYFTNLPPSTNSQQRTNSDSLRGSWPNSTSSQSQASGTSRGTSSFNSTQRSSGYGSSWSTSGSSRHMDQENKIVCSCNKEAILLTARNGPNTGRPFYRCADFQNSCNLFLWADDDNSMRRERDKDTGRGRNQTVQSSSRATRPMQSNGDEEVLCQCGNPAKRLTVVKDTPNKGRQFYICSKDRGQECRFFQWADEPSSDSDRRQGGTAEGNWNGGRMSSSGWSEEKRGVKRGHTQSQQSSTKRKCGLCGGFGHDRRNCPQKES
ncbi:DNA topoisomerase 3-alpha-like isoform X1 [Scylla paramamosain]|uniref:DNA topoisomerase 3-alpha-like isoform X1 n=1 Tax=Scylla paramamosain TaxID=85552 RepID=UPI003082BE7C